MAEFRGQAIFVLSALVVANFVAAFSGLLSHGYRVFYTYRPKLKGGLAALRATAPALSRELLHSSSFLYLVYCALFLASRPTSLALLPPAVHALLQCLTFLNKMQPAHPLWASHGQRLHDTAQPLLPQVLGTLASMQVMTGVTLLLGLFTTRREVAKTFVYWNVFLRGMFHCGDATVLRMKLPGSSGEHHKQAWRALEQRAEPLLSRVPQLQRALDVAARWFAKTA